MRRALITALLALAVALPACSKASERTDLTIKKADGRTVTFQVETAADDASRLRGLMDRASMPADEGMIFLYEQPGRRMFWMKNTLIPLDMLFFTASGELVHVVASATPETLDPRGPARDDICAVLELNGGEAARQGIKPGDRLVLADSSACLP